MDQTTASARAAATVRFEDGLGRRHQVVGVTPEPLEVLVLKEELATAPGFEDALRTQVARLMTFRHASFAQIRGVGRPPNNESGIAIISQQIAGVRLSDLLAVAEKRLLPLDMTAACWLARELISAIAVLHEAFPGACHGAIAPERIVITPDARLVVVEHLLGAALPKLRRSRVQYWRELRVALPPGDGFSSFSSRSDVTQVGTVALALMLGHPLGDDYPGSHVRAHRIGGSRTSTGWYPLVGVTRARTRVGGTVHIGRRCPGRIQSGTERHRVRPRIQGAGRVHDCVPSLRSHANPVTAAPRCTQFGARAPDRSHHLRQGGVPRVPSRAPGRRHDRDRARPRTYREPRRTL